MSSSSDSSASIVTLMAPRRPFLEAAVVVGVSSSSPSHVACTCFVVSEVESNTALFTWLCLFPFVFGVRDFPLLELDLSDVFAQRNNQTKIKIKIKNQDSKTSKRRPEVRKKNRKSSFLYKSRFSSLKPHLSPLDPRLMISF